MAYYDLTTLTSFKAWVGNSTTTDDMLLASLITQTSQLILDSLNRDSILPVTYSEGYDGSGGLRLFVKNWPISSVTALMINGQVIPAAPPLSPTSFYQSGYVLDTIDDPIPPGPQQQISLRGYRFWRGIQNVLLNYTAGYQITNEAITVPATPYQATSRQPFGMWATDQGVTYAAGGALTPVTTPSVAGQYSVSAGVYTFSAADAGAVVLVTYGYIPVALTLLCNEWAGELYQYRERIGVKSKSLGGQETVSFDTSAMPARVELGLRPYRRTTPV